MTDTAARDTIMARADEDEALEEVGGGRAARIGLRRAQLGLVDLPPALAQLGDDGLAGAVSGLAVQEHEQLHGALPVLVLVSVFGSVSVAASVPSTTKRTEARNRARWLSRSSIDQGPKAPSNNMCEPLITTV